MAAFRKVVYIDLTKGESWIEERPEPNDQWLGGTGAGTQLMMEEHPPGTDPLSPQAPIILKAGHLNGIFPTTTKGISHFESPLTGEWGESYAGGRLALAMRFAKAEPIVAREASESPCYISINDAKIEIKDVTSIWGVDARTTMVILREHEPGVGRRSIMRIGPAGENLVRIANVVVDTYRHMGMLGIGAIFGSKKRKAIVISGTEHAETLDPKKIQGGLQ